MSEAQQIRPPEQIFDGDNLPDDLKWIMTHFGLPKNDPAVVLIAWHWYRVLNNQDAIHAGAMELKAVLDPRLAKFQASSVVLESLLPGLDKLIQFLTQDDATLKAKVEGWQKPIEQVAQFLDKVVRNIDQRWNEHVTPLRRLHFGRHGGRSHSYPMRVLTLINGLLCAGIAIGSALEGWNELFFVSFGLIAGGLMVLGFWTRTRPANVVLELGGVQWNEEDFCRGWEIDGRTGSGKTASGVVPIIHQLKKNRPEVGILALDTKGDLSEPLARIADAVDCRNHLVQLEVRPDNAPTDWKPAVTMNFLADTSVPYSTYAKILVDVATAAGQKGG
jgi:hypothetical protein